MKFKKQLIYSHLENYKTEHLRIFDNGTWRGREYAHILPKNDFGKNLIDEGYQSELLDVTVRNRLKMHYGIHHLNSSQAMSFNLFIPLISENRLDTIFKLLDLNDEIRKWQFEYIASTTEGTNFDFFIKGDNQNYYFEVKYTEDNFGSAKMDTKHIQKYNEVYEKRIKQICSVKIEDFFKRYQLWRNICYSSDGIVVFVFPKFREDLKEEVLLAKEKVFKPQNIRIMHIEDILAVNIETHNARMSSHYKEFERKYLSINGI